MVASTTGTTCLPSATTNAGKHDETALGGLAVLFGSNEVASVVYNPVDGLRSGGVRYFNNTTGEEDHSYEIYPEEAVGTLNSFGKSAGLGDLELMCDAAPLQIGNMLWHDLDGDGIQDPDEPGIGDVTVSLYDMSGVLVGSAMTDANGKYYFGGLSNENMLGDNSLMPNAKYEIRVSLDDTALPVDAHTVSMSMLPATAVTIPQATSQTRTHSPSMARRSS